MLKQNKFNIFTFLGLITVQDNTMLKLDAESNNLFEGLITVQDNTMLKRRV